MSETSDFKCGTQLGFVNYGNHKIKPNDNSGRHGVVLGWGIYTKFGVPI